jgi:hypothetical protein
MSQAITLLDLENKRCKDFFYGVFFNDTIQNNVFYTVLEILEQSLRKETISNRLNITLNRLKSQSLDAQKKHALLFFAIVQEAEVQDYVLCTIRDHERRKEVKQFIDTQLCTITEKILNGQLCSLCHYVDEVREAISLTIGFE